MPSSDPPWARGIHAGKIPIHIKLKEKENLDSQLRKHCMYCSRWRSSVGMSRQTHYLIKGYEAGEEFAYCVQNSV